MPARPTDWILRAGNRLDPALRRRLIEIYSKQPTMAASLIQPLQSVWRKRFQRLPILIQLDDAYFRNSCDQLCTWLQQNHCRQLRQLKLIKAIAVKAPVELIRQLSTQPHIKRIALDRTVRTQMDRAARQVQAPPVWDSGNRGTGVGIAIVDTGIYPHSDFCLPNNRLIAFHDVINNRSQPYDDNGHGTHVAGIAAGNGLRSAGRYCGIAPEALLIGVKVLDSRGSGSLSGIIAGLEWVLANKDRHNIKVVNLSLGAPAEESYQDDILAQVAQVLIENNLVVCAAAGNSGPSPSTVATPAIHPDVIAVGAAKNISLTPGVTGCIADFSGRGPTPDGVSKPDIVAPGVNITSCNAATSTVARRENRLRQPYISLSGTSMATPMVAGIAALILRQRPESRPGQIKAWLEQTAIDLSAERLAQGHGLVTAQGAVVAASRPLSKCNVIG